MAKDPVCGMMVDEKTAMKAKHEGKTYYFCAAGCRSAFLKDPDKYRDGSKPDGPKHKHA